MDLTFLTNFSAFDHLIVVQNGTKRASQNPAVRNYSNFSQKLFTVKNLEIQDTSYKWDHHYVGQDLDFFAHLKHFNSLTTLRIDLDLSGKGSQVRNLNFKHLKSLKFLTFNIKKIKLKLEEGYTFEDNKDLELRLMHTFC